MSACNLSRIGGCMEMGAWLGQYSTYVPWPSLAPNVLPRFSWSTYMYSHWSKYIHNVSEKDLHGCLTLSAKSATSFPSVNNSSKFSSCMTEATMTSNASIILPEGDKWCLYAQCLCNYTADFNLANLEEVELVTLTGHIETLSIICTTSLVICSEKWSTVKPPITDPPKSGQPLYSRQITCPPIVLP